jgi:hypothetical protein
VEAGFFDLLLAYGLADFVLVGDLLGAQPDPLHRDGFLFHHRTLFMKSDLVFCFGNVGPVIAVSRLASVTGSRSTRTSS